MHCQCNPLFWGDEIQLFNMIHSVSIGEEQTDELLSWKNSMVISLQNCVNSWTVVPTFAPPLGILLNKQSIYMATPYISSRSVLAYVTGKSEQYTKT